MVTISPAIAFALRVSTKARLLNKIYSEHLERSEHRGVLDLREDISCGMYRQHKHFLSSVDVKKFHRPRVVPKRKHWWCATSLELSSALQLCEGANQTVENNNMCAKLRMSMCGTKAAAQNWQKKVQETMATLGFSSGKS